MLFATGKSAIFSMLAVLILSSTARAQDEITGPPLFDSEEILNLELKADFRTVFSVSDDSTYFPAMISFADQQGLTKSIEIKIRTRGKTRRKKDFCRFAPLRLNFPKSETKNTPFEGQNVLKLVTHCGNADQYEQNTILEYLIYKSYRVLTDSALKVRPAMISYIYDGKKADTVHKFSFFIEREKHLADRLQGIEMKPGYIHPDRLHPFQTCLVDVFQYMIGNTDYSIYEPHNMILVSDPLQTTPVIPVPYDFDWSGLVSAAYAVPHPTINTKSVTDRVYRGLRKDPAVVDRAIRLFNEKKPGIYALFENFELLESAERKKAIRYLDEFYAIINNERQARTVFIDQARTVE